MRTATILQPGKKAGLQSIVGPSGEDVATHIRRNSFVGPPGIEPGLYEPESYVLPVYYGPVKEFLTNSFMLPYLRPDDGLECWPTTYRDSYGLLLENRNRICEYLHFRKCVWSRIISC
ncbi:MAG: hypothetical protein G01um10148_1076 [Parcubacteria group bacterium Gr01-1014_8]|nr:MAG: hypothetical protein G01um10148_1076 [Parcubacteria group bacterium Gr01-1014_8]